MRRARTAARHRGEAPATLAPACCCAIFFLVTCVLWVTGTVGATTDPEPLATLGSILPPLLTDNLDKLVQAAATTCEVLPPPVLFRTSLRSLPLTSPLARLVEFTGESKRLYRVSSTRAAAAMRARAPAVVYVPGWWNTPSDSSTSALVTALLQRHPAVLLLDTTNAFCRPYITAVANVTPLSHLLYTFIKNIHNSGYPLSSIHLIGFSLGAHVAGLTGKLVKRKLNATLGRITALDPAKPCFTRTGYRLSRQDAQFVQVIHSSVGVLGLEEPLGHTDVYVNGLAGKHPECQNKSISLECDHALAWKMFSASVTDDRTFMGHRCENWKELLQNQCSGDEAVLGYSCSPESKGMFLYKSKVEKKPMQQQKTMRVFNPFDLITLPLTRLGLIASEK